MRETDDDPSGSPATTIRFRCMRRCPSSREHLLSRSPWARQLPVDTAGRRRHPATGARPQIPSTRRRAARLAASGRSSRATSDAVVSEQPRKVAVAGGLAATGHPGHGRIRRGAPDLTVTARVVTTACWRWAALAPSPVDRQPGLGDAHRGPQRAATARRLRFPSVSLRRAAAGSAGHDSACGAAEVTTVVDPQQILCAAQLRRAARHGTVKRRPAPSRGGRGDGAAARAARWSVRASLPCREEHWHRVARDVAVMSCSARRAEADRVADRRVRSTTLHLPPSVPSRHGRGPLAIGSRGRDESEPT
jgi:hypothetical protein